MLDPLSMFDENLRSEWSRFPLPADSDPPDLERDRLLYDEHFRKVRNRPGNDLRAGVDVEDFAVPSLIDDHEIAVRLYKPLAPEGGRGLVYFHGGAFVMGNLDFEEEKCICLAREAGCVVLSVDYRLAPEHPFPTPLEDCYSALQWTAKHTDRLSIDSSRLGIGGCSAGGALAASVAQLARDRGGPALALQMLLYPVLDVSLASASIQAMGETDVEGMGRMWGYYTGTPIDQTPRYASPAAREDLAGLAPACVVAGELDSLRDEAIAYAQRLLTAGVSVELQVWPKAPHAVDLFAPEARISRQSVKQQADALVRFLG